MTVTLTDDTMHDGTCVPCECLHPMPEGVERCDEPAAFEATHGHRTTLLCVECLEGRRAQDLELYGAVCFGYREL